MPSLRSGISEELGAFIGGIVVSTAATAAVSLGGPVGLSTGKDNGHHHHYDLSSGGGDSGSGGVGGGLLRGGGGSSSGGTSGGASVASMVAAATGRSLQLGGGGGGPTALPTGGSGIGIASSSAAVAAAAALGGALIAPLTVLGTTHDAHLPPRVAAVQVRTGSYQGPFGRYKQVVCTSAKQYMRKTT